MTKDRGQITVFVAFIVPFLFILLAVSINYALLVHKRIGLQVALDRGVFAGSARLAHVMNLISEENWAIHKGFKDLMDNFGPNSQQSIDECVQRVKDLENNQTIAQFQNIEELIANGYLEADLVARGVIAANFSGAVYEPLYGRPGERLFEVIDEPSDFKGNTDEEGDEIRRDLICGNIAGMVFDPSDTNSQENKDLLSYTYGNRRYVALIGSLTYQYKAPLLGSFFDGPPVTVTALSAAQPYGGSIKRFALLADEYKTLEESREAAVNEAKIFGRPLWFRPALVPVALAAEAAGLEDLDYETYYQ